MKIISMSAVISVIALAAGMAQAEDNNLYRVGWIGADKYPATFTSNLTSAGIAALLGNHAYVSEFQDGRKSHEVQIVWYGANGKRSVCASHIDGTGRYYPSGTWDWAAIDRHSNITHATRAFIHNGDKPDTGYLAVKYDPATGGTSYYGFDNYRWTRHSTGRVQKELPAVTWKLCPGFPSAASLGAPVDQRQTATDYETLIAQGGTPVEEPSLVSAHPEIPDAGPHRTAEQVGAWLNAHSGEILTGPDGRPWVWQASSGTFWILNSAGKVGLSGSTQTIGENATVHWSDGVSQPFSSRWTFTPTGKHFPLADEYAAFLNHPLRRAVGKLPAGTVLDNFQVVLAPGEKGATAAASLWESRGENIILKGEWGAQTIPVSLLDAAVR